MPTGILSEAGTSTDRERSLPAEEPAVPGAATALAGLSSLRGLTEPREAVFGAHGVAALHELPVGLPSLADLLLYICGYPGEPDLADTAEPGGLVLYAEQQAGLVVDPASSNATRPPGATSSSTPR